MKRIARGIKKFVLDNPRPFIVQVNHTGSEGFRGQEVDEPFQTITAKNGWGVVAPTLIQTGYGEREGQAPRVPGLDKPLGTVVAGGCKHALITPFITKFRTGSTGSPADEPLHTIATGDSETHPGGAGHAMGLVAPVMVREYSKSTAAPVNDPLGTVTVKDKSQLCAAFLQKYHGEKSETDTRGQVPGEPFKTLDTSNRFGLVTANIMKYYEGNYKGPGVDVKDPLPTIATKDHNALVTSHLLKLRGTCQHGQPIDEPAPTVTAGGLHIGEVRAFLIKYFGTGTGQGCDDPLHTITTKDRLGLVTVQGVDYQIVDIGMRMLEPRELFRAQGFPDSYIIEHDVDGHPFSKATQVKMCGNSVPPDMAEALVRANLPDMCGVREKAVAQ
jgi:DNA (cytosine-5)-methyltransferase 1